LALAIGVLAGCTNMSASPIAAPEAERSALPVASVSFPPDPPEADPYRAPAFPSTLSEHTTGRWQPYTFAVPASPTPVPTPTATPLPYSAYIPADFDQRNPVVGQVGSTLNLQAYSQKAFTWGVLDPDLASITAHGQLTLRAPGPVRVFIQQDGQRRYMLVASQAMPAPPAPLETYPRPQGDREWASWLTSEAEWTAYWRKNLRSDMPIPPVPADLDFSREALLMLPGMGHPGQQTPVITHVSTGPSATIHLVIPDSAPSVSPGIIMSYMAVYRLPRLEGTPRVSISGLDQRIGPYLTLLPPEGPPPSPPSPTPDPRDTHVPRPGQSNPPFGPPRMPTGPNDSGCPPREAWMSAARPLSLQYADLRQPRSGNDAPWAAVLPVGGSLPLWVESSVGPVNWRVSDPARASVDATGRVSAHRPGAIEVIAEAGAYRARALVPVVASPLPALRYRFFADWALPQDAAPRTARVIADAETWREFWTSTFRYPSPEGPPEVDFEAYNVVTLVHDRVTWGEGDPVLTHVSDNGTVAHLVYPGIEGTSGIGYNRTVYAFLTGKLKSGATVRVHSLCAPGG
jgi:hypothetical protein